MRYRLIAALAALIALAALTIEAISLVQCLPDIEAGNFSPVFYLGQAGWAALWVLLAAKRPYRGTAP